MTTPEKPLPDLLRELDELHEKATPPDWMGKFEFDRQQDRDLSRALRNAWPRLRDAARRGMESEANEQRIIDGVTASCEEHRKEQTRRRQRAEAERDALKAENEGYRRDHAVVMDEECAPNERHCSCVPHLRAEIERRRMEFIDEAAAHDALKAENEALREVADAAQHLRAIPRRSVHLDKAERDFDAALAKWKEVGRG